MESHTISTQEKDKKILDFQNALLNILEDFNEEKKQLESSQSAFLNILEDLNGEKEKVREQKSQLDYMAHHDYLTKIPNRRLFYHDLSKALTHAKRNKKMLAVMLFDLDGFKSINDTFGHDTGDELLRLSAERFLSILRAEDTIARLSGDEFAILISELSSQDNAALVAENLIHVLEKPFVIHHKKINIKASVGIAIDSLGRSTVSRLLHDADKAMYVAKKQGGNTFQFYNSECNS